MGGISSKYLEEVDAIVSKYQTEANKEVLEKTTQAALNAIKEETEKLASSSRCEAMTDEEVSCINTGIVSIKELMINYTEEYTDACPDEAICAIKDIVIALINKCK